MLCGQQDLGSGWFLLPRRNHGCGHLGYRFTPHSFKWLRSRPKGRGGGGGGTGTGEARRGTLQRGSCYLFKRSLVSWKGRKHRISKSDLTHLRQHLTDRRGPSLGSCGSGGVWVQGKQMVTATGLGHGAAGRLPAETGSGRCWPGEGREGGKGRREAGPGSAG